jgi:hypothetical protein
MKTTTHTHPQLSLPFNAESQAESVFPSGSNKSDCNNCQQTNANVGVVPLVGQTPTSVVVDFQTALSRRQAQSQTAEAGLYRRILDTVRHIG